MPPKLISHIKSSSDINTIGIVGSRRLSEQLRRQIDAAVFAATIADERPIQIVVDTGNRFGKHMLRRAAGLRNTFPDLRIVALTTSATYKIYFNAREKNTINNCTKLLSCADEILLFKGRFPVGTISEQHQVLAECCNIIFDGYAIPDVWLSQDLARAVAGKEVRQEILADFTGAELRNLISVSRSIGIPDPGRMAGEEPRQP